ncbi:tRNA-guanine(15) transglycosylase-like protein [Irpex rosettiformis]|uniref:tRNA-guanine(15) transglycosylase-like protein n=1 Tax=Irpex rosettiformis TaxID=378272 RepID=A0ACB8TPB0_9APHY|nr:tRNA-guanine(15) transglycosylase-like protein [Irpex rosettiformis]
MSTLNFTIQTAEPLSQFTPRLGRLSLHRHEGPPAQDILTPALITTTSRGIVPHLSRDNVVATSPIAWTQVHFETFLEQTPPVLALHKGSHPLHTFLGYEPEKHILALSLRDPHDGQEMPPNTKEYVTCRCVRGVRRVSPASWRSLVLACKPDVVTALADTPFTPLPHSQKRITKSLERSTAWLADLLKPSQETVPTEHPAVLVQMAGGNEVRARKAFAEGLVERLYGKDQELVSPLQTLDEGIAGYVFDLVPLQLSLAPVAAARVEETVSSSAHERLLKASLAPLPITKPRIVHSARSPHTLLRLIQDIGIDLFDAHFAQRAADIGIALDFTFPAPYSTQTEEQHLALLPRKRENRTDLGHNLFAATYAHDHSCLAACFAGAASFPSISQLSSEFPVCLCGACSPRSYPSWIQHSALDTLPTDVGTFQKPFTRSYIHHLLHTHEMSSHTLLAMHNLTVMEAFLAGVRGVLSKVDGAKLFTEEVTRFHEVYDEHMVVFEEAKVEWASVERARGKGRLQREKPGNTTPLADSTAMSARVSEKGAL